MYAKSGTVLLLISYRYNAGNREPVFRFFLYIRIYIVICTLSAPIRRGEPASSKITRSRVSRRPGVFPQSALRNRRASAAEFFVYSIIRGTRLFNMYLHLDNLKLFPRIVEEGTQVQFSCFPECMLLLPTSVLGRQGAVNLASRWK